jgi:hypothetical protein
MRVLFVNYIFSCDFKPERFRKFRQVWNVAKDPSFLHIQAARLHPRPVKASIQSVLSKRILFQVGMGDLSKRISEPVSAETGIAESRSVVALDLVEEATGTELGGKLGVFAGPVEIAFGDIDFTQGHVSFGQ